MRRALRIGLALLMTVLFIVMMSKEERVQRELYPYKYREEVERNAKEYGVEEYLAAAVIKAESGFNEGALSEAGAIGLMQIMPDTGEWIAEQLEGLSEYEKMGLREPTMNLKFGIWYLSELMKEYGGDEVKALAAYNAGLGNVKRWEEEGWRGEVEGIPYAETREYVKRVLRIREKYRELYGQ